MRTVIYGPPGTGKTYTLIKTHRRFSYLKQIQIK